MSGSHIVIAIAIAFIVILVALLRRSRRTFDGGVKRYGERGKINYIHIGDKRHRRAALDIRPLDAGTLQRYQNR